MCSDQGPCDCVLSVPCVSVHLHSCGLQLVAACALLSHVGSQQDPQHGCSVGMVQMYNPALVLELILNQFTREDSAEALGTWKIKDHERTVHKRDKVEESYTVCPRMPADACISAAKSCRLRFCKVEIFLDSSTDQVESKVKRQA